MSLLLGLLILRLELRTHFSSCKRTSDNNFQDHTIYVSQDGGLRFHSIMVPFGSVVGSQ